jgi:hypothetical protein
MKQALAGLVVILLCAALLSGCANTGSLGGLAIPTAAVDVSMTMAGPIDDNAYYFFALNASGDTVGFPVPVAGGPYWGNGWGTGEITHYVVYHLEQFNVFQTQMSATLGSHSPAFLSISGNAQGYQYGNYVLTVTAVAPGPPAVATVKIAFTATQTGRVTNSTGTLLLNSSTATATPPIPGLTFTTGALAVGNSATLLVQFSPTGLLLTPKLFNYTLPQGGDTLAFTVDLGIFGTNLTNLGFNIITTRQLTFDPNIQLSQTCYDGLGPNGGNYGVPIFDPRQFLTDSNSTSLYQNSVGTTTTLNGPWTQDQKYAVCIVDWTVDVHRL